MTYAAEVLADLPNRWWDTRQASGAVQPDRSNNGHSGTIHGSPVLGTDGLTFDNTATGDDQWIVSDGTYLPGSPVATFALETVFSYVSGFNIVGFDEATQAEVTQAFRGGGGGGFLGFEWADPAVQFAFDTNPVPVGGLHHGLFEYDGTNANIFLDGSLLYAKPISSVGLSFTLAHKFLIANDLCACGDGYTGLIRHGIYYEHSLGPTRAAIHATAALTDDPVSTGNFRFNPPTENVVSNVAFDVPPIWNRLRRYYPIGPRGKTVWHLEDDTITFDQPYPTVEDTRANRDSLFPAVPTPPSGYGTSQSNLIAVTYKQVYLGGHTYVVNQAEETLLAAFLTAQGYTPSDWLVPI